MAENAPSQRHSLSALDALFSTWGGQVAGLLDFLDDVLAWVKDRQGRYVWVNRTFLTNYAVNKDAPEVNPRQVLGKTDYDLFPAYLADQYRTDDDYVLGGQPLVNRIELVGQSEGLGTWNITNKIPLRTPAGAIIGTAGTTRRLKEHDSEVPLGTQFGPVLNHLRKHYQSPIANRQLAKLAGLSVRAFERRFLATFHIPPQRYLRKLRLRMASRSLVFTNRSIVDVALTCGFADQSHFTREFRRHFGRTPRAYREWYAASAAAPVPKSAGRKQ